MKRALFIIFLFLSIITTAQDFTNLAIDGLVKDDNGSRMVGAKVSLYKDGKEVQSETSERNGRFEFFLAFDHEFTIRVSKPGFVDKIIFVNTNNVPEEEQAWGYEWPITVELFKRLPNVDYSLLKEPIGKIYYEPRVQNFVSDNAYMRLIENEVKELEKRQKAVEKNEEDRIKRLEEDFKIALKDAQQAMDDGEYLMAKDNLLAAQSMNPDSEEPVQMLREVEEKLNEVAGKEEQYLSALSSADQAFGNGRYEEAIGLYSKALELKPEEAYPKQRKKESQELFAKEREAEDAANQLAAKERDYNTAIKNADKAFASGNYRDAKTYYQNALALKNDDYPKAQIEKSDQALAELAKKEKRAAEQAQIDEQYAQKIDKADAAFSSENYNNAKTMYEEASALKTDESYPKEQLANIEKRLKEAEELAAQQREENTLKKAYSTKIAKADEAFKNDNLEAALTLYQEAVEMRSIEAYPKEQIKIVEEALVKKTKLEEERLAKAEQNKNYQASISKADKLMDAQKYSEAKQAYQEAQNIKPSESYPQSQIMLINSELDKLSKQERLLEAFEGHVASGEEYYSNGGLEQALIQFRKALELKPDNEAISIRIKSIDKEIEDNRRLAQKQKEKEEKNRQFQMLMKDANNAFENENYTLAQKKYEDALRIKDDAFAKQQILKAKEAQNAKQNEDNQLALEKERKRRYQDALEKARVEKVLGDLEKARETFNMAGEHAKDETDHLDEIAAIDKLIDEKKREEERLAQERKNEEALKEKRNEFNALITQGNQFVTQGQLEDARNSFVKAAKLFTEDPLPAEKLALVDRLERERMEKSEEDRFNNLVSEANDLYKKSNYYTALEKYEEAFEMNKSSAVVSEQINRIKKIIAELEAEEEVAEVDSKRRVIEETYDEGRTKVTVRRVFFNGKEEVYKRVIHSWGGKYYFLDNQPISELVWNRETAK
ncbi:MAG: hypothetical protein WEC59_02335 [Salibacteraceae bacterium]